MSDFLKKDVTGTIAHEKKLFYLPKFRTTVFCLLAMSGLYFLSRNNYNLFHGLVDGISIVIAASVFIIVWNGRRLVDNDYYLYVGLSFLFFALLDFLHVLGNKNMGVFPGYGNLGPALYIASRYILSISLLIAPLFIDRKLNTTLMFGAYSLIILFILLSIFHWQVFPVCIIEGVGLTPFKIISDYVICLILLGSIGLLLINRQSFDSKVLWTIVFSIVLSIATGLAFTLYTDPFGIMNTVGHFFQIASFYLFYIAFIETSLTKPQAVLYRQLKQNEEELRQNLQLLDYTNVVLKREIAERKKAEDALSQSEKKLKAILDATPFPIAVVDSNDDKIEYWSPSALTLFGHTALTASEWYQIAYPDPDYCIEVLERWKPFLKTARESGQPVNTGEYKVTCKDGSIRICELYATFHRDNLIVTFYDITERINYQQEQDIMISLLQALHKETTLPSLIREVTGLMQNWSNCGAVGIRLQEGDDYPYFETRGFPYQFVEAEKHLCAVNQKGEIIRDGSGNPLLECMCGNVIRGRFNPDFPFFTKGGSFWTNSTTDLLASTTETDRQARTRNRCNGEGYESVALIPMTLGNKRIGLLQFNDPKKGRFDKNKIALFERLASSLAIGIEQRKTASALKESEEKYRSMMESMTDSAYICSHNFIIEYMNPSMIKRVGRDATGENCHKGIHGFDEKCPWCVHEKISQGSSITEEVLSPLDNKTYLVSNSPIYHTDGSISKLTFFRDISGIKEMEARVHQSQKMESIGTLAGGIAHDFNNILFPLIGHTEMLLEDIPENDSIRESLNEIYTGSLRARDLVQQILAFARQEKSELKLMKMQPIIKEAMKLIRSTIPTTINITQNLQPNCGPVSADPTQIHQIVMNLATNAYHAMEENGGELKVSLKEIELGQNNRIQPDMRPGLYACLSIADTGMGMNKDVINRIFEPFFTTKEKGKGTGMGLSVVHGIVRHLNGEIQVYSEPGKGTEFHVFLPIAKSVDEKQKILTKTPIMGGTERVLLVDDEEPILKMEKQFLERLGYQVTSRTSSIEALETFRSGPDKFDIVITDMSMPKMPGDKLSGELIKIRPDIPIILCTGFSDRMTDEKIESLGIRGLLLKPVAMKAFAEKIRELLHNEPTNTD